MSRTVRAFFHAAAAAALVVAAGVARADLASELDAFFNEAAFSTVTMPGVYQGQAGGMVTGGGFTYRVPARSYNLVSIQLPRIRMGCGGIDLFAGGFSFVNADQLVAILQNIGAVAKAFAYQLALRIISSQISSTLSDVWKTAQKYLNQTINSCEAARRLVGNAIKYTAGTYQACVYEKILAGEDIGKAKRICQTSGAGSPTPSKEVKDAVKFYAGNIVWDRAKTWVTGWDKVWLEYLMSMTGTLVALPPDGDKKGELKPYPSIMVEEGENWLRALLKGGEITRYDCTDPECRTLVKVKDFLPENVALQKRMRTMMDDIRTRIATDQPLTLAQQQLLNMTSLPLYRYLVATAASGNSGTTEAEAEQLAEVVARDMLYTFIRKAVMDVREAVRTGSAQPGDDEAVQGWLAQSAKALMMVQVKEGNLQRRFSTTVQMIQKMQMFERLVAAQLSAESFYRVGVLAGGRR